MPRETKMSGRNLPRVAAPAPYEWLGEAISSYAAREQAEMAPAKCHLLEQALLRNLSEVRVRRTFPVPRGRSALGESERSYIIPSTSVSAEYGDLPDALERALVTLRVLHIRRAREAAVKLLSKWRPSDGGSVRLWRSRVEAGEDALDGVAVQFASRKVMNERLLRDVCDCATDDMVITDVIRSLWAFQLEFEGLAPPRWDRRYVTGLGWVTFTGRETG